MKKEGAADQAYEDGKGYVDEFLFHVLSFKGLWLIRAMLLRRTRGLVHFQGMQARPS